MIMAMATKESEAGPPPKPEAFAAMQKYVPPTNRNSRFAQHRISMET